MKQFYKFLRTTLSLCLLFVGLGSAWAENDVIDYAATSSYIGSKASNTWTTFTITGASDAKYSIYSLGTDGAKKALQWNGNGYLYQTKSGGTLKSVTIKGTNGKVINIFASNTAYAAKASGTAINKLSLTTEGATYEFTDDYTFLALNGTQSSTAITEITVTYKSATPPSQLSVPEGLSSLNVTANSATLSWVAVSNANSYLLNVTQGENPVLENETVGGTSYNLTGLTASTTYNWTITAVGDGTTYLNSDASEPSTFTTTSGKTVSSLVLSGSPTKTIYEVGDVFDPAGLVVTATYTDETSEDVTSYVNWEFAPNPFAFGETSVLVSAAFGGEEDIQEYDITVNKKSASLSFSSASIELEVGENTTLTASLTDGSGNPIAGTIIYSIISGDSFVSLATATLTAEAVGDAVVQASFEGNELYAACNANLNVSVIAALPEVTFNLAEASYSTATTDVVEWVNPAVVMTSKKVGTGTNANNFLPPENKSSRFYTGNTLTIAPVSGVTLGKITYTASTENYAANLAKSTWTNATAVANSEIVTITPIDGTAPVSAIIYDTTGAKSVVVKYSGTPAAQLSSISLSGSYPIEFDRNDEFSHEGMIVTATYTDDTQVDVTSHAAFTGYDMSTAGSYTVTVSYTDGEITKTADYTITVNHSYSSVDDEVVDFTQIYSSVTGSQSEKLSLYYGTSLKMDFAKGSNSNPPTYYANGTAARAYIGNKITITSGVDNIENVVVNYDSKYIDYGADISITDKVATITFSNKCRFPSIHVYYKSESVSVSSARWATFAPSQNVELPAGAYLDDPTVRIYYITGDPSNGEVATVDAKETVEQGGTIAANTGILVKAEEGTVKFLVNSTTSPTELSGNKLVGVLSSTAKPNESSYIFKNGSQGIGFYPWKVGNLAANKCYLDLTGFAEAPKFIGFGDIETVIQLVEAENDVVEAYNLTGCRVSKGYKGIVIVNGKKQLLK